MTLELSPAERLAERLRSGGADSGSPIGRPRHNFGPVVALRTARERLGLSISAVEDSTGIRGMAAVERGKNLNLRHALILAGFYALPVEASWSLPGADSDAK
jgi:hypothetical protein